MFVGFIFSIEYYIVVSNSLHNQSAFWIINLTLTPKSEMTESADRASQRLMINIDNLFSRKSAQIYTGVSNVKVYTVQA